MTENFEKGKMPENVEEFLDKCCHVVAKDAGDGFYINTSDLIEQCESPIEQLFYIAVLTLAEINNLKFQSIDFAKNMWAEVGLRCYSQFKIGKYRGDFLLSLEGCSIIDAEAVRTITYMDEKKEVLVELDGHEFHEKTEPQRRYEKKRDRAIQKEGYKVFHYTGAEIFKDPFAAAAECLEYLVGYSMTMPDYVLNR